MRRIAFITSTALAALACVLLPSGALAHGHHHRGHHYARRGRHHGRVLSGSQPTGPSSLPAPTGTETVGATPTDPQGNAGTIVSFTEGVLTIKMGEGEKATTISGKVTEATEIHCISTAALTSSSPSSGAPGSSDDGWRGSNDDDWGGSQGQQSGEQGWGQDDQGSADDREGGENCDQCSTANLTPGTTVHRAELLLTESGAIFREIVLVS